MAAEPGIPLPPAARAEAEQRFGQSFTAVRIHTDGSAAASAAEINARAYTVGSHIAFAAGEYRPQTEPGRWLLAHELAHVVQQAGPLAEDGPPRLVPANNPSEHEADAAAAAFVTSTRPVVLGAEPANSTQTVRRSTGTPNGMDAGSLTANDASTSNEEASAGSGQAAMEPARLSQPGPASTATPRPESCLPPADMTCPAAVATAGTVVADVTFLIDSAALDGATKAAIGAAAAAWRAAGGAGKVRVDAYASADGECHHNWELSCRRAQTVASELETQGVPKSCIEFFAHGESDAAGSALAPNRRATISVVAAPPAPTCKLPVSLGTGRTGCGKDADFAHHDFPSISVASSAKLAAWALAHGAGPVRGLVPDIVCEAEMDDVLKISAGADGHSAFSRFKAGKGGTEILGPATNLGKLALTAPSFRATVQTVTTTIEGQLAAQAAKRDPCASARLDPCALSVGTIPETHFSLWGTDPLALKAVIGGTHGEKLFLTAFTGDIATRSYTATLHFLICDNFGVDEHDLYAPGLIAFWVLQHERSATLYAPFINELDLTVTETGTF